MRGEIVRFSGTLHALTHTTITSTGSIHSFFQFGPVGGVTAVGLTSGGQYVVPGMLPRYLQPERHRVAAHGETFVNNFQIIGTGALPKLQPASEFPYHG